MIVRLAVLAAALILAAPAPAQVPTAPYLAPNPYAGQVPPGAQVPFPRFIIDAECSRQGGPPHVGPSNTFDFRSCRLQEMHAHDDLLRAWDRIPAGIILGCLSLARGTGFGSYAILATCIEPQFPLR